MRSVVVKGLTTYGGGGRLTTDVAINLIGFNRIVLPNTIACDIPPFKTTMNFLVHDSDSPLQYTNNIILRNPAICRYFILSVPCIHFGPYGALHVFP